MSGRRELGVVEDLVSRKWIADIVSAEETSTQVENLFTDALAVEGLLPLPTSGLERVRQVVLSSRPCTMRA